MKMNLNSLAKAVKSTELKSVINDSSAPAYELDISLLLPNPYQPRFDEEVEELKASIAQSGLITPIAAALIKGRYIVVGGHRRLKACRELGHKTIKCNLLENVNDKSLQTLAIVENLQRQDLHPIEVAIAVDNALNNGFTRSELVAALSKSESFISKCLSVLKLSGVILDDIQKTKTKIGLDILVELQRFDDEATQEDLYFRYKSGNITREFLRALLVSDVKKEKKAIVKNDKKISMSFAWSHLQEDDKLSFEDELQQLILKYKGI